MRNADYYPAGAANDPNEIWKPIPDFEDRYLISNMGRVMSVGTYNTCKRGVLTPMTDPSGYYHVVLYKEGTRKDISIHRLVAIAFVPNPCGYRYVNHIDENKTNNLPSNLEWCTNAYNIAYSRGRKIHQFSKDGKYIASYNCIQDASRKHNIPSTNISKCCKCERATAGGYVWVYADVAEHMKEFSIKQKSNVR